MYNNHVLMINNSEFEIKEITSTGAMRIRSTRGIDYLIKIPVIAKEAL